ncbi:type III secretion system export apparatus subunit SctT [Belnapia sp. T18]|uniref:Type III secretion system export apparatus subunit SctT n=1 Tax=Belnapia arida TaxID=2804533 RepID=A0ABS1U5R3_9PROT|nr:type III secretion system export apparatus subunit SctT [Belnapia arida]MBL6080029.1 type III secretion system export apparatus subunit SctT [Belnapia arida]
MASLPGIEDAIARLGPLLVVLFLGVARTTTMLMVTPFLGRGVLTGVARNGVVLGLTLPVLPRLEAALPPGLDTGDVWLIAALAVKESVIGLLLGLPLAVLSWGIETAGVLIDNQRGSTSASSLDPATGNQASPTGIMLAQLYTVWLFVSGGFLALLDLLYRSHLVWPAWQFLPALGAEFPRHMLGMLDSVMMLALLMAGPAIAVMFLSEAGLALVSRFAPQLQVFFLAMPVKSAVGLLALALSLGILMEEATRRLGDSEAVLGVVGGWLR